MTDTRGGENREPKCFVDLHQRQVDKNAMELANKVKTFFLGSHCSSYWFSFQLREEIIPDHLEKSNIKSYVVEWLAITGHK